MFLDLCFLFLFSKSLLSQSSVFQFVKHHRATYFPNDTTSVHSFFDALGLAFNSSTFGAKWFATFICD